MKSTNTLGIPAPNMPGWYSLPDFPKYAISEDGQVWSYYKNKPLKPFLNNENYFIVSLCDKDNGKRTFTIHRLVGMAFIPLPEEFKGDYSAATINHKDHNRQNNHYTNLEWVTLSYNAQEAWDNGYCDDRKKRCFVIDIANKRRREFDSRQQASECFGFKYSAISRGIYRQNGLIYGNYIVGYIEDPVWKERLDTLSIDEIIELYNDALGDYNSSGSKQCFCIDIDKKERTDFKSMLEMTEHLGITKSVISYAINKYDTLVHGKFIVGFKDDRVWIDRLKRLDINKIIELYSNKIENYKSNKPRDCFCIIIKDNAAVVFNSTANSDKYFSFPEGTTSRAANKQRGLFRGEYIIGYLGDPIWKQLISFGVKKVIESYQKEIYDYKYKYARVITDLQTGESKQYNSLADFGREKGLNPKHVGRYLRSHSDLYKVENVKL